MWTATASAQPFAAPPEPRVRPQLPERAQVDADNNKVDDALDHRVGEWRRALARAKVQARREALAAKLAAPAPIELVFSSQVTQKQIDDFEALGGRIRHLYRAVSYGWSGTLPATAIDALPAAMGSSLFLVADELPAELHMDEATRGGRIRPIWAGGFANYANGLSGTNDITIGILDSGIDDSHTDLSGRQQYWKDFSSDGEANPRDIIQHGSHVAGIALGTGAAFGQGPGTLRYTDSGNLTGVAANSFFLSMVHVPAQQMNFTQNSVWLGGGSTLLRLAARSNGVSGGFLSINNTATAVSPLNLVSNTLGNVTQGYSSALPQNSSGSIKQYATTTAITTYPGVGDGFNAMRGVAPGARWAGGKVFTNAGSGNSGTIGAGIDDFVANRSTHNIKVLNMSLGIIGTPGLDVTLRAKANTAVNNGIVVVSSAGNDGPGSAAANQIDDPGRASLVLTVGATNDGNTLTRYTSAGFANPGSDEDTKPDLLAPGGSDYYSAILSVDSNDSDADSTAMADRVANDYMNIKGTSMATPFVAGSAALVIDAMQKSGTSWSFSGSQQPLFVKMLLCASSTETNANREVASGSNPTLGRATTPKDVFEGYGLMNPDAAIEAFNVSYDGGNLEGSTAGGVFDRRAWGRRMGITSGGAVTLTLTVPSTADYDLYLYSGTPDAKGNPVIRASSTNAGVDTDESITFTPTTSETRYLFIKRVSGSGTWNLSSSTAQQSCGDGQKQGDEQCDDGNQIGGDCCSSGCRYESNGSPCNDGLFCTSTDSCNATGVCTGSGNPCSTGGECNNSCSEANDNCFTSQGTSCSTDNNPCTVDVCTGSGVCGHAAGNGGAVCRAASGVCDVQETCTGTTTSCPANAFASPSTTCRSSAGVCDVAETCSGSAASCPGDTLLSGNTCRDSAGVCDVAETCNGVSAACPANGFASNTQQCRSSAGVCDPAETCTGSTASCPGDSFSSASTSCRASAGVCDPAENCTGSTASCPADALFTTNTVCRASAGLCDIAESCTGSTASCPANSFQLPSLVCRDAVSVCDVAELCTGTSGSCPANVFASNTVSCRAASGVCDTAETCTGTTGTCPADAFLGTTTVCRDAVSVCDGVERCSGSSASCPADVFAPSTTVCRAGSGVCDAAESCTGTSGSCPADVFASSNTVCRGIAGACDVAESCTGSTSSCPADGFADTSTTCRASAGVCDVAESCNGSSASCPADGFASNTQPCRASAGVCDVAETCSGSAAACPANSFVSSSTVCRGSTSVCDAAESCSGSTAACPADVFASSSTVCRAANGVCDLAESCTGNSGSCPADAVAGTNVSCRASAGECDIAESCNGASKSCPADGFDDADTPCTDDGIVCTEDVCSGSSASCTHPAGNAGTVCRASAGVCDVSESCTGSTTSCPANVFAGTSTTCRGASGVCDVAESCSGASASCPADGVASATQLCRASAGECDEAETCNGASKSCPVDAFADVGTGCTSDGIICTLDVCSGESAECTHPAGNAGTVCRASAGVCDLQELCTGSSASCPANSFAGTATTCRGSGGVCDVVEACSGTSANCPVDAVATSAVTCRASAGECDLPESCGGASKSCPADAFVSNNTGCSNDGNVCTNDICNGSSAACQHPANSAPCNDGLFCNGADTCANTTCSVHAGDPCQGGDGDGNCSESCNEGADNCTAADSNGAPCDDGIFCNGADTCSGGSCSVHAGDPCPGADGDGNCAESCNEAGDSCNAADQNGASCNDGLFCTQTDTCTSGSCSGTGNPCPGADGDGDCSESCNETTNDCSTNDTNGTACNDGLFCTQTDTCTNGSCGGTGSPCAGPDGDGNCAESCNEGSDNCTAADTNGTPCNDGLFCNGTDSCQAGSCATHAGNPCPGADGDADCSETCDEAVDLCTGNDPNESVCSDGLACTTGDVCAAGSCTPAVNNCGECGDGSLDAGEGCDDGNKADGDCCSSSCQPVANNTPCNDGLFCNGNDSCQSGICSQHAGDPCPGPDADEDCSESCNEDANNCTANDANASGCDDGAFCNGADTCVAGACSQHAGDPCQGADGDGNCGESCSEAQNNCSANDPNGSACDDGLFCNGDDSCQGGNCTQHEGSPCPGPDGDADCAESCNEGADNCSANDGNDVACNDGVFCNGSDLCNGGSCSKHSGDPCEGPDGDGNCSESCSEAGDNCNAPDENGSPCNDAAFCNGSDSCAAGSCSQHTGSPCAGPDGDGNCAESCSESADNCLANDPNGTSCDDGVECTTNDACSAGSCGGDNDSCVTTTTLEQAICGDATEDGKVTAPDALRALRTAVGTGSCVLERCDWNGDAKVTASDALAILQYGVGQNLVPNCPGSSALLGTVTTVTSTTTTTR